MGYHVIVELILLKINSWLARISLVAKFPEFSHFPNIPTFDCPRCIFLRKKCTICVSFIRDDRSVLSINCFKLSIISP